MLSHPQVQCFSTPLGNGFLSEVPTLSATIIGLPSAPQKVLGMKSRHGYADRDKDRPSSTTSIGAFRKSSIRPAPLPHTDEYTNPAHPYPDGWPKPNPNEYAAANPYKHPCSPNSYTRRRN